MMRGRKGCLDSLQKCLRTDTGENLAYRNGLKQGARQYEAVQLVPV